MCGINHCGVLGTCSNIDLERTFFLYDGKITLCEIMTAKGAAVPIIIIICDLNRAKNG